MERVDLPDKTTSGGVLTVGSDRNNLLIENVDDVGCSGGEFIAEWEWVVRECVDLFAREEMEVEPELGGVCVGAVGEFFLPNPVICG